MDCQFRVEGTQLACYWRGVAGYGDIKGSGDSREQAYIHLRARLTELAGGDITDVPKYPVNAYPLAVLSFNLGEVAEPKPTDSDATRAGKLALNAMRTALLKTLISLSNA